MARTAAGNETSDLGETRSSVDGPYVPKFVPPRQHSGSTSKSVSFIPLSPNSSKTMERHKSQQSDDATRS